MNVVAQVLAVLVGLTIIAVGVIEAFFYRNPRFFSILRIRPEDTGAVRLWTVNQGFENMIWGAGLLLGVVLLNVGDPVMGSTLVYFVCIAHVLLGIVLGFSEPKLWKSSILQSLPPLLVIVAALALPA